MGIAKGPGKKKQANEAAKSFRSAMLGSQISLPVSGRKESKDYVMYIVPCTSRAHNANKKYMFPNEHE